MPADALTLFVALAGLVVGWGGGRVGNRSSNWRDAYQAERVRVEQATTKAQEDAAASAADAKRIAELTADLAQLRARPDMTRLAEIITLERTNSSREHVAIMDAVERNTTAIDELREKITSGPDVQVHRAH